MRCRECSGINLLFTTNSDAAFVCGDCGVESVEKLYDQQQIGYQDDDVQYEPVNNGGTIWSSESFKSKESEIKAQIKYIASCSFPKLWADYVNLEDVKMLDRVSKANGHSHPTYDDIKEICANDGIKPYVKRRLKHNWAMLSDLASGRDSYVPRGDVIDKANDFVFQMFRFLQRFKEDYKQNWANLMCKRKKIHHGTAMQTAYCFCDHENSALHIDRFPAIRTHDSQARTYYLMAIARLYLIHFEYL